MILQEKENRGGFEMNTTSKWERLFNAITFAEAGEFQAAREFLEEKRIEKVERPTLTKRMRDELKAPGIRR